MAKRVVVGIDLAGFEKNRSGFCLLEEELGQTSTKARTIFTDSEILAEIKRLKPDLVAIDAPLTSETKDRKCDLELKQYGTLSLALKGMQVLAKRGENLAKMLKEAGIKYIEVFPRATEKITGLSRDSLSKSAHQGDAILAALTGYFYLLGKAKEVGDKKGKIVIPKPSRKKLLSR